jgi:2,3-bisphosphoglycerate-independent phosphoglycerate mutase
MVGHTCVMQASIDAVQALDVCVEKIRQKILEKGGQIFLTADHGNADEMLDAEGNVVTSHSLNPVPFYHIADEPCALEAGGKLADIAPTMLDAMGIDIPAEMTGRSLLKK